MSIERGLSPEQMGIKPEEMRIESSEQQQAELATPAESSSVDKARKKAEIKLPEVEQLREPTKKILDALRENINAGKYTVILGDETSARIPTLVFLGVLARLYKDHNRQSPQTVFVGSPKMLPDDQAKREKIADYLTGSLKNIPQGRDRALVVTEALRSGDTIKPLVDTLKELDMQFDLASIGVETFQFDQ